MIGSNAFQRVFILACAFCFVVGGAFALDFKINTAPESDRFFAGDKVTLSVVSSDGSKVPEAFRIVWQVAYTSKIEGTSKSVIRYYIQDRRLRLGHMSDGKANQVFQYNTKGQIDFVLPEAGDFTIYCYYSYYLNKRPKVKGLKIKLSASAGPEFKISADPEPDRSLPGADPELYRFLLGDKATLSVVSSDGIKPPDALRIVWTVYLPKRKDEKSRRSISFVQDHRFPKGYYERFNPLFQFNKKGQIDFVFAERGEFFILCFYAYMENNRPKSILLQKTFYCNGSLEGEIHCKNLVEAQRQTHQTGDRLILSADYLIENILQQEFFGIYFQRVPIDIKTVKYFNWSAKSGSFDERKSLEGSLPANSIIWNAPEEPGWYDVECGVDVFGDATLMATFTTKICIAQKPVAPPRLPMKILAPTPIAGEFSVPPTVTFSQVFVADTDLTASNATFIWEASPGVITGNGKTATWIYSGESTACAKTVKITCTAISSGKTSDKGEGSFELSLPTTASNDDQIQDKNNPNWWHHINPLPPPNSTPEEIHAFAKAFPAEASIRLLKDIYGIEIEGKMLGEGSPEKGDLWTPEQLYYLLWAVHEMPRSFTKYTKYIRRVQRLPAYPSAYAYVIRGQPRVYICDLGVRSNWERTIIHEMAHVWMFDPENKAVADEFIQAFWPEGYSLGTPTTAYAHTNAYEDFAEAVACFWEDPLKMQKRSPKRFDFVLKNVVGYYRLDPLARSKGTDLCAPKLS